MDIDTIRFSARAVGDDATTMATFDLSDLGYLDLDHVAERVRGIQVTPSVVEENRAYWHPRDSGRKGVGCESADGKYGDGEPGGECGVCPVRFKGCRVTRLFRCNVKLPLLHDGTDLAESWILYPEPIILPISYNPKPPANTPASTERAARMLTRAVQRFTVGEDDEASQAFIHLVGSVQTANGFVYGQISVK